MISLRIRSALAVVGLATAAAFAVPAPAQASGTGCVYRATIDHAPNLTRVTSTKHIVGSGTLTDCGDGLSATFRLNGDGPANCLGHLFKLYLDIFWSNGDYSFVELSAPALLGIGVFSGTVLDFAHKGETVAIVSVPSERFLLQCLLPGGIHTVSFVGVFGLS